MEQSLNETNMPRPDYQKMIEWLAFILRCPICSNKYSAENTSIIEGRDRGLEKFDASSMLVHTDCQRCKSSVVFSISMDGSEIFSVGMVTDLTSQDAKKFHDQRQVSADDAIEFHEFLSEFDGDFEKVLG